MRNLLKLVVVVAILSTGVSFADTDKWYNYRTKIWDSGITDEPGSYVPDGFKKKFYKMIEAGKPANEAICTILKIEIYDIPAQCEIYR